MNNENNFDVAANALEAQAHILLEQLENEMGEITLVEAIDKGKKITQLSQEAAQLKGEYCYLLKNLGSQDLFSLYIKKFKFRNTVHRVS